MTHPIGHGTANLSINVPVAERALWGRLGFLAVERGEAKSIGDYERQIMAKGLEATDPNAAVRLREIRARYYAATLAALLVLIPVLDRWLGSFGGDQVARRTSSTVRVVRVTRVVRGRFGEHYETETV